MYWEGLETQAQLNELALGCRSVVTGADRQDKGRDALCVFSCLPRWVVWSPAESEGCWDLRGLRREDGGCVVKTTWART